MSYDLIIKHGDVQHDAHAAVWKVVHGSYRAGHEVACAKFHDVIDPPMDTWGLFRETTGEVILHHAKNWRRFHFSTGFWSLQSYSGTVGIVWDLGKLKWHHDITIDDECLKGETLPFPEMLVDFDCVCTVFHWGGSDSIWRRWWNLVTEIVKTSGHREF